MSVITFEYWSKYDDDSFHKTRKVWMANRVHDLI